MIRAEYIRFLQTLAAEDISVIRRDVLVQKHGLNERQGKALNFLLEHKQLTIQDFEGLCPDVNRRSLQRDLSSEGATNQLVYMLQN